jgi:DNA polymerase III delta subunit
VAAVEAAGGALVYGPAPGVRGRERTKWFVSHAQGEVAHHGGRLGAALARELVARTGEDAEAISREAEKLALYCGDEPVDREAIRAIVGMSHDAATWDLADAVAQGDAGRAQAVLADLGDGDDQKAGIVIFTSLAGHFQRVAAVQALGPGASRRDVEAVSGRSGYGARKLAEQAALLPGPTIERMVARLARLEVDLRVSSLVKLGRMGGGPESGQRFVIELATRDLVTLATGG